ncbi:hypothetical protein IP91_03523 [Pseudoduganella lurida]|uniref:Uncharacterized protein n=1 Tax=Pseudoduganella lurida TaxID=1036180 RepID=A0A562R387_9BURK|nr:hypothetical protein [Pseudoduganella lurida]TWI63552.1 hypothetical protein IP91_03523 [Pseudoduganella lurida]
MRLLQLILMTAVFLTVLCGPALLVARKLYLRGYRLATRPLRIIVPLQLIVAFGCIVAADMYGEHNLAAMIVLATFGTSALGAGAMWAIGRVFPARLM